VKTILVLAAVVALGCADEYRDCSDLVRENAQLEDDLKFMTENYKREKEMSEFFKFYWWERVNEHNAVCTNGAIGRIGIDFPRKKTGAD